MNHARYCSLLFFSLALSACHPPPPVQQTAGKPALTITTDTVKPQKLAQVVEVQGPVAPWQEAVISAKVSGLPLIELNAEVGDKVKQGQVLARFDSRTVQAELAQARASLAQAQANLAQAIANRNREQQLEHKKFVSDQAMQLAQTQVAVAEAQQQMALAQVAAQEIRLKDCEVVAVDEGTITSRSVALGQTAQPMPGGAELFRLIRQDKLEWRAELPQAQFSKVEAGQKVALVLNNGEWAAGRVRQLAPALDQNRLGTAFVDLAPHPQVRAGMYLRGRITLAEKEALVVPAESVVLHDGRSSVFKVNADGTVSQSTVETGLLSGAWVEIKTGLSEGDHVAVKGAGFLADADIVRLSQATGAYSSSDPARDPLQNETVAKGNPK